MQIGSMFHGLETKRRPEVSFPFSMSWCVLFPSKTAVHSEGESLSSGSRWQTQHQSPLLPHAAPSPELRITQLRNIIAFKAHLNPFITKIHSSELSTSSLKLLLFEQKNQTSTESIHKIWGVMWCSMSTHWGVFPFPKPTNHSAVLWTAASFQANIICKSMDWNIRHVWQHEISEPISYE